MKPILLVTLNARYAHSSLGLRYLKANMGDLFDRSEIIEFVIGAKTDILLEKLLEKDPAIVTFGLYIWNVNETFALVSALKAVCPEIPIILGGPEISYETKDQAISDYANYIISGWGEETLPRLCRQILNGDAPEEKFHEGVRLPLDAIQMPYFLYTDEDIKNRTLYVESSRGCPFRCEFCLSSLEKTAISFDVDQFLAEMEKLYQRGARSFKFVDRTFNLNLKNAQKILAFFLEKLKEGPLFVHFEMIPDRLPESLKELLQAFPKEALQLEIGIQTFNPTIQSLISRRQDNLKSAENLTWLKKETNAHLHTDLILGLPGETLESISKSFNELVSYEPDEIQVGILKRLKGTPILRHIDEYGLVFEKEAPFRILKTSTLDFFTMQRLSRFARFWDLVANSGRFSKTLPLILKESPFENFLALSDFLYAHENAMHGIALDRLASLIHRYLVEKGEDEDFVRKTIGQDYQKEGSRKQAHSRQKRRAS